MRNQPCCTPRHLLHANRITRTTSRLDIDAGGDPAGFDALGKQCRQHRVRLAVEIGKARGEIAIGGLENGWRPSQYRCLAANDKRSAGANGKAAHPLPGRSWIDGFTRRQLFEQTVQPTRLDMAGGRKTRFQHILAIKMRTVTITGCAGVDHRCLALPVQPLEIAKGWMERKETIQREGWIVAFSAHGDLLP
ncbi:hypothetical protein D3C87_1100240 [compost metagenome]